MLPRTLIPNMEPTPLPSTEVWSQPEGRRPTSHTDSTVDAFIDTVELPSLSPTGEENLMTDFRDMHRNLPRPHHHLSAPEPETLPAPSSISPGDHKSPPVTKRHMDKTTPKAPAKKRKTQSVSPPHSPTEPWTQEEETKLRQLKADLRSRFSWKTIATKMQRTEQDVKHTWKQISKEDE